MRILTLLFLSYASMLWSQQPEITFAIKPNSIAPGDSTELIWQVKGADQVYISNIGKVSLSGRIKISPDNSTNYTLIAESAAGIISKTESLEVKGTRGEGDFPDASEFKYKNAYKLSAPSFVPLLDQVHHLLQNILGFQVSESYDRHVGQEKFVTKLSIKPELKQRGEGAIRARRIAFLVEVNEFSASAKEYPCTIHALIQYQRRAERHWRPEGNENFHSKEIQKLHELISKAFE
jgi:hypothetical protein